MNEITTLDRDLSNALNDMLVENRILTLRQIRYIFPSSGYSMIVAMRDKPLPPENQIIGQNCTDHSEIIPVLALLRLCN